MYLIVKQHVSVMNNGQCIGQCPETVAVATNLRVARRKAVSMYWKGENIIGVFEASQCQGDQTMAREVKRCLGGNTLGKEQPVVWYGDEPRC